MKKYFKLAAITLASSMLVGGAFSLSNWNTAQIDNQTLLNEFSQDQQADNVQIVNSVNDIKFSSANQGLTMFALVKDAVEGDRVYRWGNNEYGQIGAGEEFVLKVPTLLKNFWGKRPVTHILTSDGFSMIVIDNKEIWCTGINGGGQFGNDYNRDSYKTFSKTHTFTETITSIAVGEDHIAAIVDGKLYTWGKNTDGQLGHGDNNNTTNPKLVASGIDGIPKEVKCYYSYTAVLAENLGVTNLYLFGKGIGEYVGLPAGNVLSPKLLSLPFSSGIDQFYLSGGWEAETFFIVTKDNKLYAFGSNKYNTLGIASTNVPTLVSLPGIDKIKKMDTNASCTLILTESGSAWTSGEWSGRGNVNGFEVLSLFSNITATFFNTSANYVVMNDSIYAWGYNNLGVYGTGAWGASPETSPTKIDPFSTPSSLSQTKPNAAELSYEFAKKIYSDTNVFNETLFNEYVKKTGFPDDTIFTMISAPVVDTIKGEIKCTVQASKSYAQPDGAKSVTAAPFDITLTGFKVLADSKITNIPLAVGTKYNLNNIENQMKSTGSSDVNMTTFDDLFTTANFPTDRKFTIVTDTDKIIDGIYKATLNASKAQIAGYEVTNQSYDITIEGLKPQPNSTVTVKGDAKKHFNGNNIKKAINSDGKGKVDVDNLKLICDIGNFPANNVFTVSNDTSVGGTYNATLSATKYYSGGDLIDTGTTFGIHITELIDVPDSTLSPKTDANKYFNANNIVNAINPKRDGVVIRKNLDLICDYVNVPADATFTVKDDTSVDGTYSATLYANKFYLDGYLTYGSGKFQIQITGLDIVPDSAISANIDANKRFNANNIVNAINPNKGGSVNDYNLSQICDFINFPVDNKFTIKGDSVTGDTYVATLVANKYYVGGNIVDDVTKDFSISITGLKSQPDSTLTVKTDAKDKLNANNILKAINPDDNGTVDLDNLKLIANIGNFPANNVFTVSNDKVTSGTYLATISASKYYLGGNVMTGSKTFTIQVIELIEVPDSNIIVKTDANNHFNANNIVKAINPNSDGVVKMSNLLSICETISFPTGSILTIKDDKVIGDIYSATLNASKYYLGGNITTTIKDFNIQVTALQFRPDSTVFERIPTPAEFEDIISKLKEGEVIDKETLGKLIDTSYFPTDTKFTINTAAPDKDNSSVKFTFTPDKIYKDGNDVANTDGSKIGFDASVNFAFPEELSTNNIGLTVGLSICGAILMLIIIGLIAWYIKQKNRKINDDNDWVLY